MLIEENRVTKEQLKERQLLCKDLEVLCTQDSTILEEESIVEEIEISKEI